MTEKEKKHMTLAEMAAQSAPKVSGRLTCPNCGCHDFSAYRTEYTISSVVRYKKCRHCGRKFLTVQPQEKVLRPVEKIQEEVPEDEFGGEDLV